ncbi:hypothetical protein [Lentzea sp.]|uniref:hypothetical protein n=1 Tax=Lentzea sp. TaxID=56099 RepID=UPI002ED47876
MSILRKLAAVIAATAIGVLGVAANAGTAQAGVEEFQLCNYGSDYIVRAEFLAGWSTYGMFPGQCTTVSAETGSAFSLKRERLSNFNYVNTFVDYTFAYGSTYVPTWGSFDSFSYGKLPY